ncbi:MAG: hypothetical protein H0V17_20540 [Deltaproteobacteria bacterium]|nr:hypothetical protein [Deltaproteobacteria bacterium]
MRTYSALISALALALVACGGGDSPPADAPEAANIGFKKPELSMKANMELAEDSWMEIGPADFSCLNTANADPATTVEVTLSTTVLDFQSDNLVPNASIIAFRGQDINDVFDTKTSDENAEVDIVIPVGVTRFGYKLTDPESLDTLLLNQKVEPGVALQTEGSIRTVSKATAATMPALIGISRTPNTGVLAGAMRDCQDREVSNFVATVVTESGALDSGTHAEIEAQNQANLVPGTDTYYFSSSVGLPVRHTQKAAASEDGLFMVVELGVAPVAFVQVWGYVNDADAAADVLTLVAELQTESIGDTVITGSYEPLRTE